MADTVTASPPEDDPIVTPAPPIFMQCTNLRLVPFRPSLNLDTKKGCTPEENATYDSVFLPRQIELWKAAGSPGGPNNQPKGTHGDTWGSSGCETTTIAMMLVWFMSNPRTNAGFALRNRGDDPLPRDGTEPLWIAKWLWDIGGDPKQPKYVSKSAGGHPPWVPHVAGAWEWSVNYTEAWETPAMTDDKGKALPTRKGAPLVTFNGKPLSLLRFALGNMGAKLSVEEKRRLKRTELKNALLRCGPLLVNLAHPGHFVLLYGYRGRHMYIHDPGVILYRSWAQAKITVDDDQWEKAGKPCKDHVFSLLSPLDGNKANVVIDAEHTFTVGKTKRCLLDDLINAEGYLLPDMPPFAEFRTASAPDGRLPGGILPVPYKAGSEPAPVTGSVPTPSSTPARPPADPPAPPPASPPLPPPPSPAGDASTGWWGDLKGGKGAAVAAQAVVKVLDNHSGEPCKGLEVEVVGMQMGKTGADGVWKSPDFLPGTYDLKIRAKGYGPPASNGAAATEGDFWQKAVAFKTGENKFDVTMVDLRSASAVITVREANSQKTLEGVEVEIWSIATGETNADGVYRSPSFKPGKSYDVKARKEGYGPPPAAGAPPQTGEVSKPQVSFAGGERAIVLMMVEVSPRSPPAPQGQKLDDDKLTIVSKTKTIDFESFVARSETATFKYEAGFTRFVTKWAAYDPAGAEVETETDLFGHTFDLPASTISAHRAKVGNAAIGTWTVRCVYGDYYSDYPFVLRTAMPPLPVDPPPATKGEPSLPKPPAKPTTTPPSPPKKKPDPPEAVRCGLGDELTVGAWEDFVDGTVPPAIVTQIKAIRDKIPFDPRLKRTTPHQCPREPTHCWVMGDFVTSESERQELFSKWVAPLDEKWREAQSKTPDEANRARVQRGIAGAWIDMLAREGAPSAINSYDSAILTWGAGFAWAGGAGGLTNLFTFAQQTQRVRTFFHNCGFHYTSAVDPKTKKASPQALKVVDVRDGKILTGNEAAEYCCDAKQSDSPSAQGQPQLLHMLIQAARDPDMRDEVREANLSAFRKLHDRIPGLHLIKSQAVFSFIVHMHHYGPALANNCIPYAQHYATALSSLTVPSLEADAHFALWTIRHAWAGNSADFKQVQGFWRDMVADAKSRENAPLPIEGLRSAADIMKQIGMAAGSPAANAIPADHKRGYVDKKNPNSPVYDLGPLTDFPPRLKKY